MQTHPPTLVSQPTLQTKFLAIMPRITEHARIYFRKLKCRAAKDEAIAETIALAWKWFVGLAQRGKDAAEFASALATFAARAVKHGRRICGQEKSNDALSTLAQQRHGFTVSPLPAGSHMIGNSYDEALVENMQTPVLDQVAFRCDFPQWHSRRCNRDQRVIDELMVGERTQDVARRFGVSQARISQLRSEFREDWERFCGDEPVVAALAVAA